MIRADIPGLQSDTESARGRSRRPLISLPASVRVHRYASINCRQTERGKHGIGPGELLYGVPEAHIVNAAFNHAGPYGGRFHRPLRGAWYAGNRDGNGDCDSLKNARITGEHAFHYVDSSPIFRECFISSVLLNARPCLQPGPLPACYAALQALAHKLLYEGSNGIAIRVFAAPQGTALRVSGPLWYFTRTAETRIGSLYRQE